MVVWGETSEEQRGQTAGSSMLETDTVWERRGGRLGRKVHMGEVEADEGLMSKRRSHEQVWRVGEAGRQEPWTDTAGGCVVDHVSRCD